MGKLEREQNAAIQALTTVLEQVGEVLGPKGRAWDNDRTTLILRDPHMRFDVVIHSKGIAIEAWVEQVRVASMNPGEEYELVMYALLIQQQKMMEAQKKALEGMNKFFAHVKENEPEAWKRYKNIGKDKEVEDGDAGREAEEGVAE